MGTYETSFMFCPDLNGNIGSVAIYGAELEGHLRMYQIINEILWT